MINTKQFTIFFLLVVVFLVAIMIVTSLAWRESTTTYDTTGIRATLARIVSLSATKIQAQEDAMNHWVTEVDRELRDVEGQIDLFQAQADSEIRNGRGGVAVVGEGPKAPKPPPVAPESTVALPSPGGDSFAVPP